MHFGMPAQYDASYWVHDGIAAHFDTEVKTLAHSVGHVAGGAVHSSGQLSSQRCGHGHCGLRAHQPGAVAGLVHSGGHLHKQEEGGGRPTTLVRGRSLGFARATIVGLWVRGGAGGARAHSWAQLQMGSVKEKATQ